MADRQGEQLGNYRLTRLLGRGGFAEVYLGEHVYLKTHAAIKILHTQLTEEDLQGFLQEAQTIAHLEHPHIVRILDFGVQGSTPFLVMSYASGGTLRTLHPKGSIVPLATIISYIKQSALALQHAHDQKRIHRDIKPENLLVGRTNEILVSDFGIAAVAHSTTSLKTGAYSGTVHYSAPEQHLGKPRPASDQYALGIIVYEWLTGMRPFSGESYIEIAMHHISDPPPPLRSKVPSISPNVEQVVLQALAKDPQHRFATVQAFATALEQASVGRDSLVSSRGGGGVDVGKGPLQSPVVQVPFTAPADVQPVAPPSNQISPPTVGQTPALSSFVSTRPASSGKEVKPPVVVPVVSPPASRIPTPPPSTPNISNAPPPNTLVVPPTRRISRRTVLVGLAGLAVTGGGLVWVLSLPPPYIYAYRGHSSYVNTVAWSPDGRRIASGSDDKTVQVWDAADGGNAYTYRGHPSFVLGVAWSPDGKRIASGGVDHTVQVWDAANGGHVFTYRGHSSYVNAVAWSPDGKRIASASGEAGSRDYTVQVWDAATGGNVFTYRGHSDIVYAVAWSPDGRRIASGSRDHTVQVWDAATGGNIFTYRGHSDNVNTVAWSPDGRRIASGSHDSTVQVWDAATGGNVFTYRGHSDHVNTVAWSPDGRRIASASNDATVQVWDAATGGNVFTYRGHSSDHVNAVAWSPDGRRIASGSGQYQGNDKAVQVWVPG